MLESALLEAIKNLAATQQGASYALQLLATVALGVNRNHPIASMLANALELKGAEIDHHWSPFQPRRDAIAKALAHLR